MTTPDPSPNPPRIGARVGAGPRVPSFLLAGVRTLVLAAIVVAIGYAVFSERTEVTRALRTLAWQSVVLSFAAVLAGAVGSVLSWRALLAEEGHPLPVASAAQILLVGQLAKYVPGSVWSVLLQVELGRRAGIPGARIFTTTLAWVGLSVSTALTVGLLGLPVLAKAGESEAWWLLAVLPIALVASHPSVLTWLVNLVLRILRKAPLPHRLTWRGVLTAAAYLVGTWIVLGTHLWLLANALGAPGLVGVARCVGAFALAAAAGVLFVAAPSGAGIREAIIVAALLPVMSTGEALGVAVVSRVLFVVADVASAGIAAVFARRQVRAAGSTG